MTARILPPVAGRLAPPPGPAGFFAAGAPLPAETESLARLPCLPLAGVLALAALPPDHPIYVGRNTPAGRVYVLGALAKISTSGSRVVVRLPNGSGLAAESRCCHVPIAPPQSPAAARARRGNRGSFRPGCAPLGARAKSQTGGELPATGEQSAHA